ncbi:MAG: hypothetical protein JO112_17440 [Planctomycetes bacterium]|nr:hypothetical protein [Planctomycetota bacterium]
MNYCRWPGWFVLGIGLLAGPAARGQSTMGFHGLAPPPSYVPLQENLDPTESLNRLRQAQESVKGQAQLRDLLQKYRGNPSQLLQNPEDVKALTDLANKGLLNIDPNSPLARRLAEAIKNQQDQPTPGTKLTDEQKEQFQKLLETFQRKNPSSQSNPGPTPNPQEGPTPPGRPPETSNPANPPQPAAAGQPASKPAPLNAQEQQAETELAQKFAQWVERYGGDLKNSPSVRRAVRDWTMSPGQGKGLGNLPATPRWNQQVANFVRTAAQPRSWARLNWPAFYRFPMPSLPRLNLPRLGFSLGRLPAPPPMPRVSMPAPSAPQAGLGLLWIALVVALAVVAWKLLTGRRNPSSSQEQFRWRLGPWPLNPATVVTRADLVQAFEYLALLKLGPAARNWHHYTIGEALGKDEGKGGERRQAAHHLAALYEKARYAPEEESLPDQAITAARHELCLLAGVAAS